MPSTMATTLRWRTHSARTNNPNLGEVSLAIAVFVSMIHENISVSCKLLERSKSNVNLILKTRNKDKTFLKNFCVRRWGSLIPGLRTQDPPLSPHSTYAEIFRRACIN